MGTLSKIESHVATVDVEQDGINLAITVEPDSSYRVLRLIITDENMILLNVEPTNEGHVILNVINSKYRE